SYLALVAPERLALAPDAAQLADTFAQGLPSRVEPGVGVEQPELRPPAQQREVVALAVDVDEVRCELRQRRGRHGAAVHPGDAPARRHVARDDQHAVLRLDAKLGQQLGQTLVLAVKLEDPLHARGGRARADDLRAQPRTEQPRERVDEDRFARAGFAGDDVEARPELQPDPFDDGEVLDVELDQHKWARNSRLPAGPNSGDGVTPSTRWPNASTARATPATTCSCTAGSRTTPPRPT